MSATLKYFLLDHFSVPCQLFSHHIPCHLPNGSYQQKKCNGLPVGIVIVTLTTTFKTLLGIYLMKQNFKLIYTCGNTFRRGVTEPAISDHIRFDSSLPSSLKCLIVCVGRGGGGGEGRVGKGSSIIHIINIITN